MREPPVGTAGDVGLPDEDDTPALRYVGRIFGIRNAILGVMLWETRKDLAL